MQPARRIPLVRLFAPLIAVVVLASLSPTTASAQGWLAGGSLGVTRQYDYEVGGPVANSDDSDTGFRAFGGYMFLPTLGLVASYVDLGEGNYDGPAFGGFTDKLSADGWDLSVLAGWAPGSQKRFSLFGTIGIFFFSQDVHYVDASGVYDYNDTGSSLSYAAGGEVSLGKAAKWGVHFEYQRFLDVGDASNSGHEYDRDMVSVGVDYRFGRK